MMTFEYNINTEDGRKCFIKNYPSGHYSGADEQRNDFVVTLTQGVEMIKHVILPALDVIITYDANGVELSRNETQEMEDK